MLLRMLLSIVASPRAGRAAGIAYRGQASTPGRAESLGGRRRLHVGQRALCWGLAAWLLALTGCQGLPLYNHPPQVKVPAGNTIPRELQKVTLPAYTVEAPDILLIDVVKLLPRQPYHIEPLDTLQISAPSTSTYEGEPINGAYLVEVDGTVNLGPSYGKVKLGGLTIEEANTEVNRHLGEILGETLAAVSLLQSASVQQITGEHLVGPDGTVNLGTYGNAFVAGMTLAQAQQAIEDHLSQFLDDPQVSVDVFAYNSKVYYVILEGAGNGDQIISFPITGNETVLDAMAQVQSTTSVSSHDIWVARPAPDGLGYEQMLPVNWKDITRGGQTATNYQIFPGDRILVREDHFVALATIIQKVTTPVENLMGTALLGGQTITTLNRLPDGGAVGNNFF